MILDLVGTLFSLLSTIYFIQMNNKAWLVSLAACLLNSWLYWSSGIFADMVLEGFYFITTFYGLYRWKHNQQSYNSPIKTLTLTQGLLVILAIIILYLTIYFLLSSYTSSNVKQIDALTTALSLVGELLMCHKIIATWFIWFITDALYALLYYQKGLSFHTGLMIIYTFLAIVGYLHWRKISLLNVNPLPERISGSLIHE